MAELGRILIYEALRDWLPTVPGEVQSPMGVASIEIIDPRDPGCSTSPSSSRVSGDAANTDKLVQATKNVNSMCRDCDIEWLIYTSSIDVTSDGVHNLNGGASDAGDGDPGEYAKVGDDEPIARLVSACEGKEK